MQRIAVIGLGLFGRTLARSLAERGEEVLAIDKAPQIVQEIKDDVTLAVRMDTTDEKALWAQDLNEVDVAVVSIGSDHEASELTTLLLKKIGVKRVIARATTPIHARLLDLIGADEVICPEDASARRLSLRLVAPNLIDNVELATGHSIAQLAAPQDFVGKSIADLKVRQRYHVNIVAIKQRTTVDDGAEEGEDYEEAINDIPGPDYVIQPNDVLVVVGNDHDIASLPG